MPIGKETVHDLVQKIYCELQYITSPISETILCQYFSQRVILAARNIDVDTINACVLRYLPGDSKRYFSIDTAFNDAGTVNDVISNEYLNTITIPGMPVHETVLKIGCPIILLRNLNPYEGLCNGTRLIVTTLSERVIEGQILTGIYAGRKAFIPRISLDTSISTGLGFILRRHQFPIRLGFAMSINKSQGQSLDRVGIYLNNPIFAHGQLYVALSRCTDHRNLFILLPKNSNRKTLNIVYKEVIY